VGALCFGVLAAVGLFPLAAGAASPTLTITPAGPYHDGESVAISVGANTVFTPSARINVLECADPGGTTSNLPKDDSTCDGNTIQGNTVIVNSDGGYSLQNYVLYALPSAALGEQANDQPVCNETQTCVLFIGQDQNDFTQPKLFSPPFTIASAPGGTPTTFPGAGGSSGGAPAASGTSGTSGTGSSAAGSSSPGTTLTGSGTQPNGSATSASSSSTASAAAGTLAFTGAPTALPEMVLLGTVLLVGGALLRRRARRRTV
jgi:hypothetical protein